jgi:hypothetical protein
MAEQPERNRDRGLFECKAAAARVERARSRQIDLLPTEASPEDVEELPAPCGPGRAKGARTKSTSKFRQMLATRGYRMPEDMRAPRSPPHQPRGRVRPGPC